MMPLHTALAAGDTSKVDSHAGIIFMEVAASSFKMGAPPDCALRGKDEDQVDVRLSKFWISETEVSWRQWDKIIGAGSAEYILRKPIKDKDLDLPVVGLSYFELNGFLHLLTIRCIGNKVFPAGTANLPTEAQWEYVARNGSDALHNERSIRHFVQANNENIGIQAHGIDVRACGYSKANKFGCRDMLGNVSELCRDVYASKLPGGLDPFVHLGDIRRMCFVVRGAPYISEVVDGRPTRREFIMPYARLNTVGFRVVWEMPPTTTSRSGK